MSEYITRFIDSIYQWMFAGSAFQFKNLHYLVRWLVYGGLIAALIFAGFGVLIAVYSLTVASMWGFVLGITVVIVSGLGFAIPYYVFGHTCWAFAYNKDRNADFAFTLGFLTGMTGTVLYWIYTLFHKKNPDNWEPDTAKGTVT